VVIFQREPEVCGGGVRWEKAALAGRWWEGWGLAWEKAALAGRWWEGWGLAGRVR
jgi:hypothetical protein